MTRSLLLKGRTALAAILLLAVLVPPWPPAAVALTHPARAVTRKTLHARIAAILRDKALKGCTVAVKILEARSGATVFERNGSSRLLVASNVKLFTTAAALELLGKAFIFRTILYTRGTRPPESPGTLAGDLVVKASGDPNISGRFEASPTAIFEGWAAALQKAGIRQVTGDLRIDDTVFDRHFIPPTWPREQLTAWYCAPIGGFSLNDNCIDITVRAGPKVGAPARISFRPATGYVTIVNRIQTVSKTARHVIDFQRKPGTNRVIVRGTFRVNAEPFTGYATIDNPPAFAGSVLLGVLRRSGIRVNGRVVLAAEPVDTTGPHFHKVAEHSSTLLRSIAVANRRSQNFYAEQILKRLGRERYPTGSLDNGIRAVQGFLRKVGLQEGYVQADGSGLSRRNRFSAADVVTLLRYMSRSPNGAAFRGSLAVPGAAGSLHARRIDKAAAQRVQAKTGTLHGASALSGYAVSADGTTFVFSILMNGYKNGAWAMRRIQDRIVKELVHDGKK